VAFLYAAILNHEANMCCLNDGPVSRKSCNRLPRRRFDCRIAGL